MGHRLTEDAKGVYLIAATPFADDGALDLEGIDRLVDFYLGCGVHGLTILGMMGEANKLTAAETDAVASRFLKAVNGRVPVIVGASSTALATVTDLSRKVMDQGAAGVMIAPSGPLKTDDQIYGYMEAATAALGADVPVVYQDYPQSTGIHLSPALWKRIADAFPSIVMLKHEDCPGLAKLSRVRADEAGRRRVSILVGNGALYYLEEMERGADGAMTGFGFPEMLVGVYDRCTAGDWQGAASLFDAYMPFTRYEQQPGYGLAVRKEILRRRGAVKSARARWPAPSLGKEGMAEVDGLLRRLRDRLADVAPEQAAVVPV